MARERWKLLRVVAPGILTVVVAFADTCPAQDYQIVPVGNGVANSECVGAGANASLDTTPAGDDTAFATSILSGPDGICDTSAAGDDVQLIGAGAGLADGNIIGSGVAFGADTICDDSVIVQGDDVILVSAGNSKPRQLGVLPGPNGGIDTPAAGGDDDLTGVICPGTDGDFDSTPDPADDFPSNDDLCDVCPSSQSCIIPGVDGVLQTTAHVDDDLVPVILTGDDGICDTTATGDDVQLIDPGDGFLETFCVSAGPDGIAQTTLCGNGIADADENGIPGDTECEDGNTIPGDGCSEICQPEVSECGNGTVEAGEECDDGNRRNNDACVVGCKNAFCGDGFKHRGVEECEPPNTDTCDGNCNAIQPEGCGDSVVQPPEECDDGNHSNRDDCLNNCTNASCGDDYRHTKGTPPFEECDDGNTNPGDGCSASCEEECGNGVIDGACSEGKVGEACSVDEDCDTTLGSGDGVCFAEACDPGIAGLCQPGPEICSNLCEIVECGNGEVECDEECDLGFANGIAGSGCEADCTRNLVGRREPTGRRECPSAWTLDEPPRDLNKKTQKCKDSDPCDFDTISGQCTFRVGVCINRTVPNCTPGGVVAYDLRLRADRPDEAAAAESLTAAVAGLAPAAAEIPDRCREGLRGKICAIPEDNQCDRFFGSGDGTCDIGAGVLFSPALDPADQGGDQVSPCTPGVDIVVNAGAKLRLRSTVRLETGRRDRDGLRLFCEP